MISLRTILRGVLTRFLPAFILATAIMYGLASLADRINVGLLGLATLYALMTLGYTAALVALRYRLRADADVAGRRSVVAGLLAPAAYLGGLVLIAPTRRPRVLRHVRGDRARSWPSGCSSRGLKDRLSRR
ncbi:MAG: hypothetical protein IPO52_06450 [Gemmatimonadetes bacterium]|nr:hypothetical protein [Gemmatimonadota bacterium]